MSWNLHLLARMWYATFLQQICLQQCDEIRRRVLSQQPLWGATTLCFSVSLSFLWHSFMLPSRKREVGVSFIVNSSSFTTESTESSSIQKHTLTWFSLSTMSVLTEYHDVTEKTYLIWPIRIFLFRKSTYSNQFMIESEWTLVSHLINSIKVFPRKRVHKKRTDNPQNMMPILQCLKMYAHTHSLTQCFSTLQETSKTCRTVFPEEQGWKTLV